MKKNKIIFYTGVALVLSTVVIGGCKKKEVVTPPPIKVPPAVTPSGSRLPAGLTADPKTGEIKGAKPMPVSQTDLAPPGGATPAGGK